MVFHFIWATPDQPWYISIVIWGPSEIWNNHSMVGGKLLVHKNYITNVRAANNIDLCILYPLIFFIYSWFFSLSFWRFLRAVAYRWIIRWLCGYMGWENTRPLSACIYEDIRQKYKTIHLQPRGYRQS